MVLLKCIYNVTANQICCYTKGQVRGAVGVSVVLVDQ